MLSVRVIVAWSVLVVAAGVGVAVWLLLAYTGGDTEGNRLRLDAIRTAGTIVVGTGGAAALLLAARRQRSTEIALRQKDRDQADVARAYVLQERVAERDREHQLRVAAATEADAEARRITDLYTKAVEQVGSDKAPIRLGGFYALERLAQDNPGQRQTIVNVVSAYLRMPYTLPGDPPDDEASDSVLAAYRERTQEREVRLTAQRLLRTHLRPGSEAFWPGVDLDLTDATLVDFDLIECVVRTATFAGTRFTGTTRFHGARFDDPVTFAGTRFDGAVLFDHAVFPGADFRGARFDGEASFREARLAHVWFDETSFGGPALFNGAEFTASASFHDAVFAKESYFRGAAFEGIVLFQRTEFGATVSFSEARFADNGSFRNARFADHTSFRRTQFGVNIIFDKARFASTATFDDARFTGAASFHGAVFPQGVPPEVASWWKSGTDET